MAMPTRVLSLGSFYPPHHLGGYETVWRGVMEYLRSQGHRARILTTDYRRPGVAPDAPEDPDVHRELDWYWREHEWRAMGPLARLRLERRNAAILNRHLSEFQPDVITWWPVGGMSLGLIEQARRSGVPSLLFVHDYWLNYGPEHDLWTRMWSRLRPAAALAEQLTGLPTRVDYAAAGRWVFCSRTVLDHALASGVRIADSAILSPGIENAYLNAARQESPSWSWRLVYIGRIVEQKGVRTAIESLALLPSQASVWIVGDGDPQYRLVLERLAASLGVARRVHFLNPRPRAELIEVYRGADAVVFPVGWAEPWGLVPLEAMALGAPVVATGRGGSGDYLVNGWNSLLFEAGDASGLAVELRRLADDAELRRRLRQGGYETAARHGEDSFNQGALAEIQAAARFAH
ncbi:MAG: glycosyltransferase family 4 protein [Solirubrobacteraceae bacterium]